MIVAVAVRHAGVVHQLPCPNRHHHVLQLMHERGAVEVSDGGIMQARGEQGFVDDAGNFLSRQEAARHALECGQITELNYQPDTLFSEDLW